jgi:hypothetical protein
MGEIFRLFVVLVQFLVVILPPRVVKLELKAEPSLAWGVVKVA